MIQKGALTFTGLLEQDVTIEIPIIQRDYAQGRKDAEEVRLLFLRNIFDTLSCSPEELVQPLDLDFVYGSLQGKEKETFWPLDGQQRLTTLFLLHWYLATRDGEIEAFRSLLLKDGRCRFTYQTRTSSALFFNELAKSNIVIGDRLLSDEIRNSKWFFLSLEHDPTVKSALSMLDAIHTQFGQSHGFYQRLAGGVKPYIAFQFLNLDDFGLSDDLYIKMNARGKALTTFENFKARFEQRVGELCPGEMLELGDMQVSTQEYLSRKIDTDWADLFWGFCGEDTNVFDEQWIWFFCNLFAALSPVSIEHNDIQRARKIIGKLREDNFKPSYYQYQEVGCIDKAVVGNLIILMDVICDGNSGLKRFLPDSVYYDEREVFKLSLVKLQSRGREAKGLVYQKAIQFFGWCLFLIHHKGCGNADSFFQWMRVIHNLSENSRVDDVRVYVDTLFSLKSVACHSLDILGYLASPEDEFRLQGFYRPQVREERIKAQLIKRSTDWENLICQAEQHPYFLGQIEFLLDFCGVLDYFVENNNCNWSNDQDVGYQSRFQTYLHKAMAAVDKNGPVDCGDYLFERAMLAKGDYLLKHGYNHSLLKRGHDRDISWKRLLRGSERANDENKVSEKRKILRLLFDDLDVTDIKGSFEKIIREAVGIDKWREWMISDPKIMAYCESSYIRHIPDRTVLLMKRTQTNGAHLDLQTYHLYLADLSKKPSEYFYPFSNVRELETFSIDEPPGIHIAGMRCGESSISLGIHSLGNDCQIKIYNAKFGSLPDSLILHMNNYSNAKQEGDRRIVIYIDGSQIENGLKDLLNHLVFAANSNTTQMLD